MPILFADDTNLFINGDDLLGIAHILNTELENISHYLLMLRKLIMRYLSSAIGMIAKPGSSLHMNHLKYCIIPLCALFSYMFREMHVLLV